MGEVTGIALRARPRAPMQQLDQTEITLAAGLTGDFRGAVPGRQVTVLSEEGWLAACAELGEELPWVTRRANLLLRGVELKGRIGGRLRVGDALLIITDECEPCSVMERARGGLRRALLSGWRGGATCRVARGGLVRLGDAAELF
ncbi:MAG: MOSC domain-containing protein [Pseudomonadota bacterium]|jgi:MOSC domain-containing protein YiiM|nr:MOSC domain-containing protein [Alphaproteobacteria bacterium]